MLGTGNFQEVDLKATFGKVAQWSATVLSNSQHPELINLAVKSALTNRGVSQLIFPYEVAGQASEAETGSPEGRLADAHIPPAPAALEAASELLEASNRLVIVVGHGARFDMPDIVRLAEAMTAPVLTTFKAKGQIPDRHPLAGGVLGRSGTAIASWFMNEADLLLVLGASFSNHTGIDSKKRIIQVDFDRKVVAVSGDGGFGQCLAEVTTAVKYGMNITHVLLNNFELGKISKEQRSGHWEVWQTSLHNPNFAAYAELCGARGIRVTDADQLDDAPAEALAHPGPSTVEILTDPELV